MRIITGKERPRLAVLGLDGLPWSLARDLCEAGVLPHLSTIIDQSHPIRAELPELSPVNWTSFATACGPEDHGVFGFTRLDPESYTLSLADAGWVQTPTIMDRLGEAGLTSKIINLPNTWPAAPLRGMLVAGFVAPDPGRAFYPPFLQGPLTEAGYVLEADTTSAAQDPASLLPQLNLTLAGRSKALAMLWPDLAWDLFIFVLTETDRLFHFLFPAIKDASHPLHQGCLEFLIAWDKILGEFLIRFSALPDPKRLIVLADHGFCKLDTEVDLNVLLQHMGLLQLGPPTGDDPEYESTRVLPQTRAFALDPGRVYIHTPVFSRGSVDSKDVGPIKDAIRQELLALTFNGRPAIEHVHDGDALYPGAGIRFPGQVPDLVAMPFPGFDLKAKWNRGQMFSLHGRFGMHTAGDVFFMDSQSPPGPDYRLRDTGRLVLDYFGL